ncbi:MAG: RnfABCDGE type electron transport complex subunit D [Thermodesulfobacteriota bacterium]
MQAAGKKNTLNQHIDQTEIMPTMHVAPSPHVSSMATTTRGMMLDVLIALVPVVAAAFLIFGWLAAKQLLICVAASLAAEVLFTRLREGPFSLMDLSAVVTGLILGLSLPATAPWYVGFIGAVVAIGVGKLVFGGLGMNIFNPAMVGRAFVMIAFAGSLAASGYVFPNGGVDALSQATPLTAFKQSGVVVPLSSLFLGNVNGSLGETSALACLLGGIYLCVRRAASWEIPAGILLSVLFIAGVVNLFNLGDAWTVLHQLASGALLFGAFYIATDPVTSPLTSRGRWIYGVGIGAIIMLLRYFSGYPEGVMFAVLLMNAVTPLINRWNIPRPFGGV